LPTKELTFKTQNQSKKHSPSNKNGKLTKETAVETYSLFLKMQGLTWSPPKYKAVKKLPFIPTEDELNSLIAGCNRKTSVFLQLLKETGMRCGEAFMLKWTDFNFENRTVDVTSEKGSEPRQLKLSTQLIAMLNSLLKDVEQPFRCSQRHFTRTFRQQRTKIAIKKMTASEKSTSTHSATGKPQQNTLKPKTFFT
jgi:integrase